jgi:hypothetical protein
MDNALVRATLDPHQTEATAVHDTLVLCHACLSDGETQVAPQEPKLRFAVGAFESWEQLRQALDRARLSGLVLDSFNCLGLERIFAGKTILASSQKTVAIQPLLFPEDSEVIACTSGPLAARLTERLHAGNRTLQEALARWLIPRHARHFADAVRGGKILLWIRVINADEERHANQTLLATSSNSVGVHDLMLPGENS